MIIWDQFTVKKSVILPTDIVHCEIRLLVPHGFTVDRMAAMCVTNSGPRIYLFVLYYIYYMRTFYGYTLHSFFLYTWFLEKTM